MGVRDYLIRNSKPGENLPPVVEPNDTERSIQQIKENVGAAPIAVTEGKGEQYTADDVFKRLLDKQYKTSENDLKKRRAADFWGNLATVAGQTFASSRGARQFTPIKANTEFYNDKLSQLKNWRNQVDLNKTLTDYQNEFLLQRDKAKQIYDYNKQVALAQIKSQLEGGLIDKRTAANLELQVQKAKDNKELEGVRQKNRLHLADKNNNAAMARTSVAQQHADSRAQLAHGDENGKNNESIVVNRNGQKVAVSYPKSKRGAVMSLYNRMKQLSAVSPGKYGDTIEDINMKFGEGGDQSSKAMTIIQRRLQDFPELTSEFDKIVGGDDFNKDSYKRGGTTPNPTPRLN